MERLTWGGIVAAGTVIYWRVKSFWDFWSPTIEEVVKYSEELAKDGEIDLADRKKIALKAIDLIAAKKNKKIGFLERWLISWLIDRYAGRLIPHDIKIPELMKELK